MVRYRFPRVFELIDLIEHRDHPNAYFWEFESRVRESADIDRVWRAREVEFSRLDAAAWEDLKIAAKPYLAKRSSKGRGWEQLISTLNEARGYIYLKSKGCAAPRFIPRSKKGGIETPDLKGSRDQQLGILCEVKTIHISEDEIGARETIKARPTETRLSDEFLNKLDQTITKAFSQLLAYEAGIARDRVAFIILNFDEWAGEYKREYYAQVDEHLACRPDSACRVVFFNSRTAFHFDVEMQFAEVVNE